MIQNREVKNSVFVDLFCMDEKVGKKNFLELYNAFHGTNLKLEETEMEIKIIPQALYKTFINDVGMMINGKLVVLIEHQSTINNNMPLRMLLYVSRIYEGIVPPIKRFRKAVQKIPTPEFYVLYNGTEDYLAETTLKLSDAFYVKNDNPALELSTKVININVNKKVPILSTCPTLNEYCKFMEIIREVASDGTKESYEQAIRIAMEQNILKEYLEQKATEVINMLTDEYNYEDDVNEQRQEAFEEGIQQGSNQKAFKVAKAFLKEGISIETVAKCTGLSLGEVEKLKENA